MRRKGFLTIAALVTSMVFSGCMSSTVQKNAETSPSEMKTEKVKEETQKKADSNTESKSTDAGETAENKDAEETGEYTDITLWDGMTDGDGNTLMQALADGFAAEHGIQVERVVMKMEDLRTTIKAAINSGEGPDVFSYEIGAGYLGVLANSGLAFDLTSYAADHGWDQLFMDNAISSCTFNGKLYGIGNELEALGVFYNRATFEKYGLKEPETYEEFEEICATLKEKGELPIMVDDLDQWPGYHYESLWTNAFAGCDTMNEILALKQSFNQDKLAEGLDKLHEIVTNGWTIDAPLAMAHDDARKMFLSGKAAMYPTGTWEVATFGGEEGLGDDCGFFFLPSPSGTETSGVFGLGGSFVVNAKSDKTFTAIKFMEYMFNEENVQKWYEASYMPATTNAKIENYQISSLFMDWADSALNSEKQGNNLDVLMPTKVNEATANYMQELLAGKKTGIQCMEEKQTTLEEEVKDGNYEAVIK